jgi:hypothetical protein
MQGISWPAYELLASQVGLCAVSQCTVAFLCNAASTTQNKPYNYTLKLPVRTTAYLLTYSMEQSPSWEADQFSQLTKKFPTFYGTRRFFTLLTSARHLSLSWANSIQSPRPPPTSWKSILILSSHLRLVLPNFNQLLISSWMEFWSVNVAPRYFNSSTLSMDLLSIFMPWPRPAFRSRDITMYLVLSVFASSPISNHSLHSHELFLLSYIL